MRNKTIDISVEDGAEYLARCIPAENIGGGFSACDCVICGDCFAVMPELPRGFADLVVADPPYNIEKDFNGAVFRASDEAAYEEYTERWISLTEPLMTPDASIYVCSDWRSSGAISRALSKHFIIRNRITWQREKGRGAARNWKNGMEDIWFATRSPNYTFNLESVMQRRRVRAPYRVDGRPKDWHETADGNFRDTCPSNFWDDLSIPYWSMPENTAHPTQKPEKLLAKIILAGSDAGQTVFDPFGGSGTTAVTAKKLGRHYVTIERDEQFCVWAQKRLEMADSDNSIQGYSDGVFWERNTGDEQLRSRKRSSKE